jgi:hypothetical protein
MLRTDSHGHNLPAAASIALNQPPQVLASRRLAGLAAGETLLAQSDFELTNDVISSSAIRYDVGVTLAMILAASPQSTSGTPLTTATSRLIPWREHHFTFTPSGRLAVPASLKGHTMYVNVVASASLQQPPSGCVAPHTGQPVSCRVTFQRTLSQLGVVRLPGGARSVAPKPKPFSGTLLASPLETDPGYGHRTVVWSSSLLRIRAGDILDVSARLRISAQALAAGQPKPTGQTTGCNALISGQLYLSGNKNSATGSSLPALGGDTGFNLTQAKPIATWLAYGFWEAPNGTYGRRYVELVAWSSRSQACPDRGVPVRAAGSGISVRVYRVQSRTR